MNRDDNVWARTETGKVFHFFPVAGTSAACRSGVYADQYVVWRKSFNSIGYVRQTLVDTPNGRAKGLKVCTACLKKFEQAVEIVEDKPKGRPVIKLENPRTVGAIRVTFNVSGAPVATTEADVAFLPTQVEFVYQTDPASGWNCDRINVSGPKLLKTDEHGQQLYSRYTERRSWFALAGGGSLTETHARQVPEWLLALARDNRPS